MSKRSDRQSFLGKHSDNIFQSAKVAIVGLGGGGSHVVQQLAHIGFDNYVIYDPQEIEDTNLNRLVGATSSDIGQLKTSVAVRVIKGLRSNPSIEIYNCRWQDYSDPLVTADVIMGCVDSFSERRDLEATARRYMIPFIDIGMGVFLVGGQSPRMAGQVIASIPGGPCMFCLGFLNEESLAQEAAKYGDTGDKPQVVWPNGVLASSAVGLLVQLLTGWASNFNQPIYLSYDGNLNTVSPHVRLDYISESCSHYPVSETGIGDPVFRTL